VTDETRETVWELRDGDPAAAQVLAESLQLDPLVATLLVNRGVTEVDAARRFLNPLLREMPDPFLMKGMEEAVTRILEAFERDETVCVWGDYDVDGVTSASQLISFFEVIGYPARFFVPDRFRDGYGLHSDRIRELAQSGVDLLITVDCGISNVDEVEVARQEGMEVIIVDHHTVPPTLPRAFAVIDPIQDGCEYPFKGLAACGITFMLLVALRMRLRAQGHFEERLEPDLKEWLELAAIGTVADMVPLRELNRTIVHHGLEQIRRTGRPGVEALCNVAAVTPDKVTAGRIGFHLGPRINAAGRLAHASAGVELLTTDDPEAARKIASEVDRHNKNRQALQKAVFDAASVQAERAPDAETRRVLVVADEGWHEGVVGIVASKLVERFHLPTVVLSIKDGVAKGSARSIQGFHLVDNLRAVEELLTAYGGHYHAAGMTLPADRVDDLRAALDARAHEQLDADQLTRRIRVDTEVPLERLTYELAETLLRLAPYGMGNPEPSLMARGVEVLDYRLVGKERIHVKLILDAGTRDIDAIAFSMADRQLLFKTPVDIVYIPEINEYNGRKSLQVRVKDLRASS
jgi:single-stranded-DNA-specific exonuclease